MPFALPSLEPTSTAQSSSIARSVCLAPQPDAFQLASSGSSNCLLLSRVSSKPFLESTLISFAWTNMNLKRTRTHSSVANSKLSGNSLPLSPKEMPPNVNATRSLTKTDLLPRVPVSNNSREHCRVQAQLRDHGRCRSSFPQNQNHGQHPKVLLFDLLHWIPP